jgi:hypothetical protein
MSHRVYGIRHHGPGSAQSLASALAAWQPDCVLVEGPPDANELIAHAADPQMQPPVALLTYASEAPESSVFHPFAAFSPEWIAIRWALAAGAPVRFIDLPMCLQLGPREPEASEGEREGEQPSDDSEESAWKLLCEAGGFADSEALWDRLVETRAPSGDGDEAMFAAIAELMGELRADASTPSLREQRREAHMRIEIRRALKEGHARVAVVCGAWHAPVLRDVAKGASADAALLKGLARCKVATTWIPWSFGRLTRRSGYGAGIASPGWYAHLHARHEGGVARWLAEAAIVFRGHDLEIAPSHVIEAVRLADTLATMRGFAEPSLDECVEAIQTIYCAGDPMPMAFLGNELLIGERLGTVPSSVPEPALGADVRAEQKRLRLKVEASQRALDLDLRTDTDLQRSRLLHRLQVLRVPWGELQREGRKRAKNTFHEIWTIAWGPELSLALIEAGRFGNTVERAANNALLEACAASNDIARVAQLLDQALRADCGDSVPELSRRLDTLAAGSNDIPGLVAAMVQLAPVLRYGDVRKTDVTSLRIMLAHYAERICIGLPMATANVGDELADQLSPLLAQCDQSMRLLASEDVDVGEDWERALHSVAASNASHALLAGRATRLLLARGVLDPESAAKLLSQALSPGVVAAQARWLEGLLADGGLFLVHDGAMLGLLDEWLRAMPADQFETALPIVRRAFSALSKPERRQVGQLVASPQARARNPGEQGLDWSRADRIVPVLVRYLGLEGVA